MVLKAGIAERDRRVYQRIDVALVGPVIDDRSPNRKVAIDNRGRRRDNSGFMKIDDYVCIQLVRVITAVTEAHDVQENRCKKFKLRRRGDFSFQTARQLARPRYGGTNCSGPMNL